MKDALTVEGDSSFAAVGSLPAFYAQDLIMFGIKRNFPDAVRAGEKIMIEGGEQMPKEISRSVRNYMLKNSDDYYSREAMARSGPLNTTSLYRSTKDGGAQPLFCLDDPYWSELMRRNYKRED